MSNFERKVLPLLTDDTYWNMLTPSTQRLTRERKSERHSTLTDGPPEYCWCLHLSRYSLDSSFIYFFLSLCMMFYQGGL